eukprot:TRINITY_DN4314_c0_g5_i1.p1 TRINITY_DN4314_c0_g5~~TRINITY_DN4314_c0_g5_i1.p1  ORF type:complete len:620 (+),score=76.26 TRINITY_DN4314_c0_g5_i1:68-1861(+)
MRWHALVVLLVTFTAAKRVASPREIGDAVLKICNLDKERSSIENQLDAFTEFRSAILRVRDADLVLKDSSEHAAHVLDFLVGLTKVAPRQTNRIVEVLKKVLQSTRWMSALVSDVELKKRLTQSFTEKEQESFGLPDPGTAIKEAPSLDSEPSSSHEDDQPSLFSAAVKDIVALNDSRGFENRGDDAFSALRVACLRARLSPEVFDKQAKYARDVTLFLIKLASTRRTLVRRVKEVMNLLSASKAWANAFEMLAEDAKSTIPDCTLKALGWNSWTLEDPTPFDESDSREDSVESVEAANPTRSVGSSSEHAPLDPNEEDEESKEKPDTHVEVPPASVGESQVTKKKKRHVRFSSKLEEVVTFEVPPKEVDTSKNRGSTRANADTHGDNQHSTAHVKFVADASKYVGKRFEIYSTSQSMWCPGIVIVAKDEQLFVSYHTVTAGQTVNKWIPLAKVPMMLRAPGQAYSVVDAKKWVSDYRLVPERIAWTTQETDMYIKWFLYTHGDVKSITTLFNNSQLPKPVLKEIWKVASSLFKSKHDTFWWDEFQMACRLIAICQSNLAAWPKHLGLMEGGPRLIGYLLVSIDQAPSSLAKFVGVQ